MPIQLPSVNRIEPQSPVSLGRLNDEVPNGRADLAQTTGGLEGIAQQAIKFRNDQADQAADSIATQKTNQFETWHKMMLYGDPGDDTHPATVGLINQQGDPTENFKNFRQQANDKLKDLSSPDTDSSWDDETQKLVNRRLGRKAEQLSNESLTEYGNQQRTWDDNNTKGAVKLAQDRMVSTTSALIDPAHPDTLDQVKGSIADIKMPILAQAIRYGGAKISPTGEEPYVDPKTGERTFVTITSSAVQAKIQAEVSKAVFDSTDNLIKSGTPGSLEKAQLMKNTFSKYFENEQSGKLDQSYRKEQVNQSALQLSANLLKASPNQVEARLAKETPDVADKAREMITNNKRRVEDMKRFQQQDNYQALGTDALQFKRDNPAATITDYEQTPQFKQLQDKLNPKDMVSIEHVFNPPRTSDPSALAKIQDVLIGKGAQYGDEFSDPRTMTPASTNKLLSGLSPGDRSFYGRQVFQAAHPSSADQTKQIAQASSMLKDVMYRNDFIDADNLGRTDVQKGGTSEKILGDYRDRLIKALDNQPKMTTPELNAFVSKFAIDEHTKTGSFAPPGLQPKKPFQATGQAFSAPQAPAPTETPSQRIDRLNGRAIRDFKGKTGLSGIPTQKQLEDFKAQNPGKYQ